MRVPAQAVALVGAVLVVSGCGSAAHTRTVVRTHVAPAIRAVRVAHASGSGSFAIFPPKPGTKKCVIPGGAHAGGLRGTCQTRVYPGHLRQGARVIVAFTEYWGYLCRKWSANIHGNQ